ncbi:MAG TPA: sugar phosphate isomerase/epimerase [Firmicutes bacterium]|nr:sugar phosphate isomerase/epimerase [Bacillota bacterium]
MELAVSMWSLHRYWYAKEMDVLGFLAFAKEAGVSRVELLNVFWRDLTAELPAVIEFLSDHGLRVSAYDATNNFVQESDEARQAELRRLLWDIEIARALGAPIVRVFSGDARPGIEFEKAKGWIVEGLRAASRYAARRGIVLALENHGLFAGRSEQVEEILDQVGSPALMANLDTANFLLVDDDPLAATRRLASRTGNVHLKDFREVAPDDQGPAYSSRSGKRFKGTIAGQGQVPIREIVAELKKAGYRGALSIEFEGREEPKAGTMESLRALERLVAEMA